MKPWQFAAIMFAIYVTANQPEHRVWNDAMSVVWAVAILVELAFCAKRKS